MLLSWSVAAHPREGAGAARLSRFATRFSWVALLGLVSACTSYVPATVTSGPGAVLDLEPAIFVTASSQIYRVRNYLEATGLQLADSPRTANYLLHVTIGKSRSSRDCGTINNVVYSLSIQQQQVIVIKGRGKTGSCSENILDDMSQQLAYLFQAAPG